MRSDGRWGCDGIFRRVWPSAGFPDYEIIERVGRGGMGVVYRARQLSLNRIVALKVIAAGDLASPAALARFRREAEAAAKLDHPNIVPIYEVGEHEARPFLVMPLIEGTSLAEFMTKNRREEACGGGSKVDAAVRLIAAVARAVDYAHRRGVLHRDLKPNNILLDSNGIPHLTDFGIAKLADEQTALTETADVLGTPAYMAPEQAAGRRLSASTDVYSLGVILYELLTGRRPFEAAKPVELLRKVMTEEPADPRLWNGSIGPDLATICLKCLDKDPARRYGSALEFAEDLERWGRREPIVARPAGPALRLRRWTERNPVLATLLAGLTIGMALTLGLLAKAREERNRKAVALAILRTETARQLQEIWASPSPFFSIKSETLAAMAGRELSALSAGENRFTLGFTAMGNPLDSVLGAAGFVEHIERSMAGPTRIDLRLYKSSSGAVRDLIRGDFDFMQMNVPEYLRAKARDPGIEPLVTVIPWRGPAEMQGEYGVIFTREETGIKTIGELRGRSFLFGRTDSALTFWAKVCLAEAGVRAIDLSRSRYLDAARDLVTGSDAAETGGAGELGNPFSDMTPVEAVVEGRYDAAVVSEGRFKQVAEAQGLVQLGRFRDRGLLLAGRSRLAPEAAASFRRAMVSLKDPQVLQLIPGLPSGFRICTDADFAEMRSKLAAEATFEGNAKIETSLR